MISRRAGFALGGALYLLGGLGMFIRVLLLSPTRATTCPCSDSSLFAWYFEWLWVAIRHGMNPFFSTAVFHPMGTNLLANTSSMALGAALLPITAIFGPIASVNVALVAAPFLSGLAAMWVATRWTSSLSIAWLVGALYAFSPAVLAEAAGAHLMLTFLAIPPLILACFDELLVRRRRSPVKVGLVLAALIIVQFFIGTEMLVLVAMVAVGSLIVLGIGAFVLDREGLVDAVRFALPGLVVAAGVSLLVLIGPALYALVGPQHYVGPIWAQTPAASNSLRSIVIPVHTKVHWWDPTAYRVARSTLLGPGLIIVLVAGSIIWRKDRRLLAASTITAVVLGLGLGDAYAFAPWHYLRHLPLLVNVFNDRFGTLLLLPAGLVLARVLDHTRARIADRRLGQLATGAIAVLCVAPFLPSLQTLPYSAHRLFQPLWYQRNGSTTARGQVILQMGDTGGESNLSDQALHQMAYSITGGGPPQSFHPAQPAVVRPGAALLTELSTSAGEATLNSHATPAQAAAVRAALEGWRVTLVVLTTDVAPLNPTSVGAPYVEARWLISVLGPATWQDGAWVWHVTPRPTR